MIRRFEVYTVRPGAPSSDVTALVEACRHCGRFIPEVLDSRVGWDRSGGPRRLVWEHAFTSPETYQRYMVHRFHSNVLDRYLLPDAPERVVVDDDLGAGLFGYHGDRPVVAVDGGVRRLVLLQVDRGATAGDVAALMSMAAEAPSRRPQMLVSVVAANTLGATWFDGVHPVTGPPPRWTHVWEQCFRTVDDLAVYRAGDSVLAQAERRGFDSLRHGVVRRHAELFYALDGSPP